MAVKVRAIDSRVVEAQSRVFAGRLDISKVLRRARIHRTMWWRWVAHGAEPKRDSLARLNSAIDTLIAEKDHHGQESRNT